MASFSRQHYKAIAGIIRKVSFTLFGIAQVERNALIEELIDLFKQDNPLFDEAKFREEIGKEN